MVPGEGREHAGRHAMVRLCRKVRPQVCFIPCLEVVSQPNASAWERIDLPSQPTHPRFPAASSHSQFLRLKKRSKNPSMQTWRRIGIFPHGRNLVIDVKF